MLFVGDRLSAGNKKLKVLEIVEDRKHYKVIKFLDEITNEEFITIAGPPKDPFKGYCDIIDPQRYEMGYNPFETEAWKDQQKQTMKRLGQYLGS